MCSDTTTNKKACAFSISSERGRGGGGGGGGGLRLNVYPYEDEKHVGTRCFWKPKSKIPRQLEIEEE